MEKVSARQQRLDRQNKRHNQVVAATVVFTAIMVVLYVWQMGEFVKVQRCTNAQPSDFQRLGCEQLLK